MTTDCNIVAMSYYSSCENNSSIINGKFKRLEPHFQLSATGSASKVGTKTAVILPPRECTKEPISALPNYVSKGKLGARMTEYRTRKI